MMQTERLILRAWTPDDKIPFRKMNQDPEVLKYFPSVMTAEQSDALVDRIQAHFQEHGFGLWATELKSTGEFMGFIGLSVPTFEAHFTPAVEIGWRLDKAFWGKGYATEGALKVLENAFTTYGLSDVVSFTAVENVPSIKLMQKIGLTHDPNDDFDHPSLAKDHWLSRHVLYRASKADWVNPAL